MDLIARLTPVIDRIRGLHAHLGTRPYRVWRVRTRWTGTRRGGGEEVVVAEREVVPTPRVTGIESLDALLTPTGREEDGLVELSEISLSESEEDVAWGWGVHVPHTEEWYWEIRYADGRRRRFVTASAPERDVRTMGWRVRLRKQRADRQASGLPSR